MHKGIQIYELVSEASDEKFIHVLSKVIISFPFDISTFVSVALMFSSRSR